MARSKKRALSVVLAIMMMFTLILPGIGTAHAQELDKGNLPDGTYEIGVALWHASNPQPSMAAGVLQDVAEIVVEDNVYTMTVYTQTATIIGMPANLEGMEVFDKNGNPIEVTVGEVDGNGNPTSLSFEMPHTDEFISVSVISMAGNMNNQARLKLDWDSLTQISGTEDTELIELEDGTYEINIALWHASNNQPSMAAGVIQDVAEIAAKDGVYTMTVYTQTATIFGHQANLRAMEVFDKNGNSINVTIGEVDEDGNPASISFVMPHTDEFISVKVDSGMSINDARLQLDWSSLIKISGAEDSDSEVEDNDLEAEDNDSETGDSGSEAEDNDSGAEDNGSGAGDNGSGAGNNGSGAGNNNPGTGANGELDINNLADGTYELGVELWHATNNQPSMAAAVIQDTAGIIVEDGVYTMVVHTQEAEIMGMPAKLESKEVFDKNGNSITVMRGELDENGNPTSFSFEMPHTEEFIDVSVTSTAPMSMTNDARLKLDWSSLTKVSEEIQDIPTSGPVENSGNNGNNGNNGSNESDTGNTVLDKDNLEDGIYEVEIALWHATNDTESMANGAFKNIARIVVEDGDYTMFTYNQPMSFGTITASLQAMRVENAGGGFSAATVQTVDSEGNPTSFSFAMPHTETFIDVQVNPMVALMGNDYIDARLNVNWSTLRQVSDTTDLGIAPEGSSSTASGQTPTLPDQTPNASGQSSAGSVQTGDDTNMVFYAMALLFSGLVIGFYIWKNVFRKAAHAND